MRVLAGPAGAERPVPRELVSAASQAVHRAPAFWLGLVDGEGEVVATHAVVLVDCTASSFGASG
ncbi:hypothetical protein [Azospirillum brasilense]|uniref:hypothetical protein n=1 Tax=Azospirillum brasilense TaxID=192 RepID=UPI0011784698|nr:hypothetical protein [Azospirillum brasilense]